MPKYGKSDLAAMFEGLRERIVVKAQFLREHIGGQPATERGMHDFIHHQMGIDPQFDVKPLYDKFGRLSNGKPTNPEFINTFNRLRQDELMVAKLEEGEPKPGEELIELKVYGVKCIRRDDRGPFMLDHMIKAAFKCAASRLNLYDPKRGIKGDVQELGTVLACGDSLQDPEQPWKIYLRKDGKPAETYYRRLQGRVQTSQGSRSIQYDAETVGEGTEFSFEFRWLREKMGAGWRNKVAKASEILKAISAMPEIGLGSARSMSYGKWEVVEVETQDPKPGQLEAEAAEAAEPKKSPKASQPQA